MQSDLKAMPSAVPPALAPSLDSDGRLNVDLPCRACGYDLRGLLPDGVCPECAHPIQDSLRSDALHLADRIWLQNLKSGLGWLILWFIIVFLADLTSFFLFRRRVVEPLVFCGLGLGRFVGTVCGYVGVRLCSIAEPGVVEASLARRARLIARISAHLLLALALIRCAFEMSVGWVLNPTAVPVHVVNWVVFLVCITSLLFYGKTIVVRIQNSRMASRFRLHIRLLFAIGIPYLLILVATYSAGLWRGSGAAGQGIKVAAVVMLSLSFVLSIVILHVLVSAIRVRREFDQLLRDGRPCNFEASPEP